MSKIASLEPQIIWNHFAKICEIPRPSLHEQGVIDYIITLADAHGLEHQVDPAGNLIVRKPATAGMEDRLGVIIQGHMDMVAQKATDLEHDFLVDPIRAYVDGDWVTADRTTLGADNGIGVAYALAVLEAKDIPHPDIEALFTVNEEAGMSGALGLQPGYLKGDWLFNLDTEQEGELYVGCAGGIDIVVELEAPTVPVNVESTTFILVVGDLKGGHSGVDIHQGRANANKLTNIYLQRARASFALKVASFDGGSLRNAIPRDARTTVVVANDDVEAAHRLARELTTEFRHCFGERDRRINVFLEPAPNVDQVYTGAFIDRFIQAVDTCPDGVDSMIPELPEVVETSNNLARVVSMGDKICLEISARSSVGEHRDALAERIRALFRLMGARVELPNAYPGWNPDVDSSLLQLMQQRYQALYGEVPKVKVIHAGLECGVIGATYPHWQMISFGPTITGAHSPDERVCIADVARVWDYFKDVLGAIPVKR